MSLQISKGQAGCRLPAYMDSRHLAPLLTTRYMNDNLQPSVRTRFITLNFPITSHMSGAGPPLPQRSPDLRSLVQLPRQRICFLASHPPQ
ncbi:unnamed protein product [Periconia digitata]|uniref:Uncharacterized protein n=1 Tax=Periconia digitata TaxID=1303443 RepID=A0A9W4UTH6_9PLEO|nr:unnamed protein product [Periconia digitata]